jgi:hypothetical protein
MNVPDASQWAPSGLQDPEICGRDGSSRGGPSPLLWWGGISGLSSQPAEGFETKNCDDEATRAAAVF